MYSFEDLEGREWKLSVTIGSVRQVKETLGVDLLEFPEVLEKLSGDIYTLCNVLYVLIKPQADKLNVSDVDFGYALGGDVLEKAVDALLNEMINFFPQRRRDLLMKLKTKSGEYQETVLKKAEIKIESLDFSKIIPLESGNS